MMKQQMFKEGMACAGLVVGYIGFNCAMFKGTTYMLNVADSNTRQATHTERIEAEKATTKGKTTRER